MVGTKQLVTQNRCSSGRIGHSLSWWYPWATLAAIASISGCASQNPVGVDADGYLRAGTWGGDSAAVLAANELTHVHVGCSYGDIPGRFRVMSDGSFQLSGSYVLRAYPVAVGPELPAEFVGEILGDRLTLVVTVDDTVEKRHVVLGPVVVRLGVEPRMGPCPICTIKTALKRAGVS